MNNTNSKIKQQPIINDKSSFSKDISNWLKSIKISCKRSTYSNYEYTVNAYLFWKLQKETNKSKYNK